jgi:hypothetical protein
VPNDRRIPPIHRCTPGDNADEGGRSRLAVADQLPRTPRCAGFYDPVAYFDGGKPMHGIPTISASYGGARYLFATSEHRRSFLKNPRKYVPEFGGFCVVGTAFGEKVDVDLKTGEVVNGKLYLNNSQRALDIFNEDQSGTIAKAKRNWPIVRDKVL